MRKAGAAAKPTYALLERRLRLILLKRSRLRREGSLAAALAQSMALAVISTAGAYPSWVLVEMGEEQIVLGAAWAITRVSPPPNAPLLGPEGAPIMLAIAFCCLFSVLTGSLALALDFLGRRRCRMLAPVMHGLTAVLIACTAALGSCLLALVRGRTHTEPELAGSSTMPGQSLFLAFLACTLASTATGLSCTSPARVEPARSSWDFGTPWGPRFFQSLVPSEKIHETTPATLSLPETSAAPSLIISSPTQEGYLNFQQSDYGSSLQFPFRIPALREEVDIDDFLAQRDHSYVQRHPSLAGRSSDEASHSAWPQPSMLELARSSLERCFQPAYILEDFFDESENEAAALPRREGEISLVRERNDTEGKSSSTGIQPPEQHLQVSADQKEDNANLGEVTSKV